MVSQVEAGGAPTFEVAGVAVDTGLLLSQAVAMAGQYDQLPYDETAAGPTAAGGGGSVYSDNLGDVLDLLAAQGVIPPVALQFGVPDRSEEHTSELQSLMRISYAVFCLKKKKKL